jgi:hypothetical protein
MADQTPPDVPQFRTAQYPATQGGNNCGLCGASLGDAYYRINGNVACEACAMKARAQERAGKHSAFARALIFGVGAAILGLVLYSAFTIATGIEIGFVSLAVGYLIGKGMKFGANGAGGRRYQIAAVLLTYAAVSLSAIPIALSAGSRHRAANQEQPSQSSGAPSDAASSDAPGDADASAAPPSHPSSGVAILGLVALGLASPFLELQNPLNGAIGLFIFFIGMRFAWRMTAGVEGSVFGPFQSRGRTTTSTP